MSPIESLWGTAIPTRQATCTFNSEKTWIHISADSGSKTHIAFLEDEEEERKKICGFHLRKSDKKQLIFEQ